MTLDIRVTTDNRDDTAARLDAILNAQAEAAGSPFEVRHFAFEAWENERFLGGLTARMVHDWMFVALLAVRDSARGKGIGRQLIGRAEDAARGEGANGLWLDTFSFQAPGFYERLGYSRIAELPDSPTGGSRYLYGKRFETGGS